MQGSIFYEQNKNRLLTASNVCGAFVNSQPKTRIMEAEKDFEYVIDRFADIKIMRYKVPEFENLTLNQKIFIYYLSQAAQCGRDIIFDQFYRHNLLVRRMVHIGNGIGRGQRVHLRHVWRRRRLLGGATGGNHGQKRDDLHYLVHWFTTFTCRW